MDSQTRMFRIIFANIHANWIMNWCQRRRKLSSIRYVPFGMWACMMERSCGKAIPVDSIELTLCGLSHSSVVFQLNSDQCRRVSTPSFRIAPAVCLQRRSSPSASNCLRFYDCGISQRYLIAQWFLFSVFIFGLLPLYLIFLTKEARHWYIQIVIVKFIPLQLK